jgi:hypothetical protein
MPAPPSDPITFKGFDGGIWSDLKFSDGTLSKISGEDAYKAAFTSALITATSNIRGIRFKCGTSSTSMGKGWKMLGLKDLTSTLTSTVADLYNSIDFGFTCSGAGWAKEKLFVHYGNTFNSQEAKATYTASTLLEVYVSSADGQVKWYVDGVLVTTKAFTTSMYPLHVLGTIYQARACSSPASACMIPISLLLSRLCLHDPHHPSPITHRSAINHPPSTIHQRSLNSHLPRAITSTSRRSY